MDTACRLLGLTRQAYYQRTWSEESYVRRVTPIIDTVHQLREMDPGIGGYKLWLMVKQMHPDRQVPGRDAFRKLLGAFGLTLKRPKPRHTTNSNHRFHKYKNLIRDFVPTAPNRLWVSDITYIDTEQGCCYLHLVTDAYSRKITGWSLAPTLEAKYTVEALRMAIQQTEKDDLSDLIHHSDRGVQYCCDAYIQELNQHHIRISMTEDYKPTDNAIAERVNGAIKTEVIYREKRFKDINEARGRLERYIQFYNDMRPHYSIGMKTPSTVQQETGMQERKWKSKQYVKAQATAHSQ